MNPFKETKTLGTNNNYTEGGVVVAVVALCLVLVGDESGDNQKQLS